MGHHGRRHGAHKQHTAFTNAASGTTSADDAYANVMVQREEAEAREQAEALKPLARRRRMGLRVFRWEAE